MCFLTTLLNGNPVSDASEVRHANIWLAARSAAAKFWAYDAKSWTRNSLRMLKAKSTHSNAYVAKALKACHPSISPTIPA